MKLYKYSGTIEELAVERGRISYIKLFDVTDFDKAPTKLEVFGALGKYIEAIEGTDAEERYIKSDWYFDSNLYLRRIEVPGVGDWPAKIITQSPDNIDQLEIFGEREYIETSKPKSMPGEEVNRWLMWERQNMKEERSVKCAWEESRKSATRCSMYVNTSTTFQSAQPR